MKNIFYSIIKADCQEISSSLNDNGLLEVTIPKNCTNEELSKYFYNFGEEEQSKIVDKQKKAKEVFRKKVKKMIEKYRKEFDLDLIISLRIQNDTKKLNDCRVEVHGISFDSNLLVSSFLQYSPDELVEKMIRSTVFEIACQYAELWDKIKSMSAGVFEPSGGETKTQYKVSEKGKYRVSVPDSEIKKINEDYETACKQIVEDLSKRSIRYR